MIGYLRSSVVGAASYNAVHNYAGPAILAALGFGLAQPQPEVAAWLGVTAASWAIHVGLDRMLGYGPKFSRSFKHTHLGGSATAKPRKVLPPPTHRKGGRLVNDKILITGGTGKTGRRIAQLLRSQGVPVRPASRSTNPSFDWADPPTWRGALDGVRSVYLTSADVDEGPVEFVSEAADAGVERIVLLSARGISTPGYFDEQETLAAPFLRLEDAVTGSGMRWNILRPGWFMQNFSEGDFLADIRAGRLELPAGKGAATWVDAADIAAVAARLLTDGGFEGEILELGGPEALSVAQAVAIISRQSGSDMTYEPIPEDIYRERLKRSGVDEESIIVAAAALSAIRRGHEATLVDGVQRVLRREPTRFETFAQRERDAWQ